jgi:hypothetical protein
MRQQRHNETHKTSIAVILAGASFSRDTIIVQRGRPSSSVIDNILQ